MDPNIPICKKKKQNNYIFFCLPKKQGPYLISQC